MHIILGGLGLIVSILVLVNRLTDAGIDIGWLDPFKWNRRRKWRQAYHADPVYAIDDPMKATAGLMYTMAKCTGEMTREQKECILSTFYEVFKLTEKEAVDLLSTCSFYIKQEDLVTNNIRKFLQPSIDNFADEQKKSAFSLIEKVAYCEGKPNEKQIDLLGQIKECFTPKKEQFKQW